MTFFSWGICDVEDCSSGALHLANTGKGDIDKLCIDGGSAGGFTTLACLAFTDVFKAGKFKGVLMYTVKGHLT